jgi:hypothetical protein
MYVCLCLFVYVCIFFILDKMRRYTSCCWYTYVYVCQYLYNVLMYNEVAVVVFVIIITCAC